jgi:hypothetical protein
MFVVLFVEWQLTKKEDIMHYKTFPMEIIKRSGISKMELAKWMGIDKITFDPSLPQQWLDEFVKTNPFEYKDVYATTVCAYPKGSTFGVIISGCTTIDEAIGRNEESEHIREAQAEPPLEYQDKEFDLLCRKLEFEMRQYFKRTGNRKYTIEFGWQNDKPKIVGVN